MADDAPLSQLCSICNISPFKYKCPGCSAQTCSLPCYKRHQQWAQCSGKRDPTKFVKRSQLETPAGIDHDFNFLTSIERGLQRAERVENTTSGSASALQHGGNRRKISNQQLEAAGVAVIRAPQGLSRQKQNATHRGKSGHIVWSIEWIRDDDCHIFTECSEVETLQRLDPFRSSRKRKRIEQESAAPAVAPADNVSDSDKIQTETSLSSEQKPNEGPPLLCTAEPGQQHTTASSANDVTSQPPEQSQQQVAHNDNAGLLKHGATSEPVVPPTHSFFLLKPQTISTHKVLIPLSPDTTLADSLRGKTVLEFPTIYVFTASEAPPSSEKFLMEEAYLQQEREEQAELDETLKKVDPKTLKALERQQITEEKLKGEEEINSEAILDVLQRDLGAKGVTL
ncbi:hypothetical protein DM02DRAFT_611954 [Periconia macrospinosa]|uniref:Box C/D snoRNA protein 1 n=1 Tax=Periconia macrospinosa TaxID=97972 RepID=A0A2V1E2F2_9PLEO|nr:hypothetical protein DM02DRAFT_611954 [Periconia macrospinosa]